MSLLDAWVRRGIGPQPGAYLIDLCCGYRLSGGRGCSAGVSRLIDFQ